MKCFRRIPHNVSRHHKFVTVKSRENKISGGNCILRQRKFSYIFKIFSILNWINRIILYHFLHYRLCFSFINDEFIIQYKISNFYDILRKFYSLRNSSVAMLEVAEIIRCSNFAAIKHKDQRRKDKEKTPYINHPIGEHWFIRERGILSWISTPTLIKQSKSCIFPIFHWILSLIKHYFTIKQ
jgi:hypothetical protein